MASVYNSTPFIPSTGSYSYPLDEGNEFRFDNRKWEDVKSYNSVILTVSAETPGYVKLRWAQGHETEDGDEVFPDFMDISNPLARDQFFYPANGVVTKQFDMRARFLNVWFDGSLDSAVDASLTLATVYKKAATEIKLTDEDVDIVAVHLGDDVSNSLYVGLTDFCGHLINSTLDGQEGEALYTHLADSSGQSLAHTESYRHITRIDKTDFSFNNDVNSRDWTTVITETNEFMLPSDGLPFKHGDIVKFIVLREGEDEDPEEIFEDGGAGDGYLKVRAKIHFTVHNDMFTKFQLLVNNNIARWFDTDIKRDAPRIANFEAMESGDPDFVLYDEDADTYRFLTHNDDTVARVETYYNIIADPSGFNMPSGIEIGPGRTPLDLRFYRGSFHNVNTTQTRIILERRNDPNESLAVALRDSNNLNMASTQGETSHHFQHDYCHPYYPRVLIVLDDVSKYNNPDGDIEDDKVFLRYVANTFGVDGTDPSGYQNYYNRVVDHTSYIPIFNEREDGPCYAVIQSSSLNEFETDNDFILKPDQLVTTDDTYLEDIEFQNSEDLSFNLWETALNTVPLIEEYNFTDIVFITASAHDFSYGDTAKDALDSQTLWQNANRYIVVPTTSSGEDLIHFVGGQDEHIISYPNNLDEELVNHPGQFSEVFIHLINQIHKTKHQGHNALTVHPSNVHGDSQGGTVEVEEAAFGDTALYYSLVDLSAHILDSTYTAQARNHDGSNNALFVHLNMRQPERPGCAESITPFNPLPVAFQGEMEDGKTYDLTVSGPLTTVADISNGPINLHSINIVNETATPVWVRLYDVCSGLADALEEDFSMDLSYNILFNLPVPALETRDIPLARPVTVEHGLHFAASTNYRRDTLFYPPGKKHIFVNGNFKLVTVSASVLADILDNDVDE